MVPGREETEDSRGNMKQILGCLVNLCYQGHKTAHVAGLGKIQRPQTRLTMILNVDCHLALIQEPH